MPLFLKRLLGFLLSLLLIGESIPSHALPKPSQKDLESNVEQASFIMEGFFDGKKMKSPGVSPPAVGLPPTSKNSRPLLLAEGQAAKQAREACEKTKDIHGGSCTQIPDVPKKEQGESYKPPPCSICEPESACYDPQRCSEARGFKKTAEEAEKKRAGEAYFGNVKNLWSQALKPPQSEKEALKNLVYFVPELIFGALLSFFIYGIPIALGATIGLVLSLGYLVSSPLAGAFQALWDGLTFKSLNTTRVSKDKPLSSLSYTAVRLALFLALLPISLPVAIYQSFNNPQTQIKRLKDKQERLSQDRNNLQDKKEQLQRQLERLYQGEIRKPRKTGKEPLPEVVKIDVPPYENPAEGITEPIARQKDLEQKPPPPTPQEQIKTLDKENASLHKEVQDLHSEIQFLEKRINEEYRRGQALYRNNYLKNHNVTEKETDANNAIAKEIKKNLGNNLWQNPELTNNLTPENRELIKGLDLRFELAKGSFDKEGQPLLGVLHETAKNKSEPTPTIILQEPPFVIPSASLRIVKSPGNNLRTTGAPNHGGDAHGGADIECDWGPKRDGYGIPVGLRHKTQVVYTYRETDPKTGVDKGFGNTIFLLDLDQLKTNPNQRVFWILAHEGEYNKPLDSEGDEPRFSGILADRGETIEPYHPVILLGRSGNAIKAGKRGSPVPQVHIEKIVVTNPQEIKDVDEYVKNQEWDRLGLDKLRKPDFRSSYRRDPLEGYK